MPEDCVIAVYQNYEKAYVGLQVLDLRGFTADSVSVITASDKDKVAERERLRRRYGADAPSREKNDTRAAYFTVVTAQTLLGVALGPLLLVGPIAALVCGTGIAAIQSISAAISPQVTEAMGRSYEQYLLDGCVIVVVYASGDELIEAVSGMQTTDTLSLETYRTNGPSEGALS